jgi:hypothetical protein
MNNSEQSFSEVINQYFVIDEIKHYLPLIKSGKLDKSNKSIYYGAMSNFTSENFKTLHQYHIVKRDKEKDYTFKTDYTRADLFELNIASIPTNICVIDIDGDNAKMIDFKTATEEEKMEWIDKTVPELIKNLPYTLSRTKQLPHYYFILDGIDKDIMKNNVKITQDCLTFCSGDLIGCNVWEKPDAKIFNYTGELPIIHYDDLRPYLLENVLHKLSNIKKPKKTTKITKNIEKSSTTETNTEEVKNIDNVNYNLVETFIKKGLLKDKCDTHKDWIEIAYALKNEFGDVDGLKLFELLTLNFGSPHKKEEYVNQWKFIKNEPINDNITKITMGSIKRWAKANDSEEYKNIINQNKLKSYDENVLIATGDNEASSIILNKISGSIKSYKGRIFYKLKNIWIHDKTMIDNILIKLIMDANIYKISSSKSICYSANIKSAKNILDALYATIISSTDDTFILDYNKLHTTTKGRLCFKDGVLDFKNKKFYEWDDIDFEYYSPMMINRDYADYFKNPDKQIINKVKESVFDTMYGDKTNTALHFLSRAITGHSEDKNWLEYIGNRNCGKGVQYDALSYAFENYVGIFELRNMLYNRMTSGTENVDCSKKLY